MSLSSSPLRRVPPAAGVIAPLGVAACGGSSSGSSATCTSTSASGSAASTNPSAVSAGTPPCASSKVSLSAAADGSPPGTYTFHCPVPGHEAAGMKGTLTVR
jgi:hypothetical protein